jgi:hypothetical protein
LTKQPVGGWIGLVKRRCASLLILLAFVFSTGGHWYALQAVAWARMVKEYSQKVSVPEAVAMTFSGRHPCTMCKAIAAKKQEQKEQQLKLVELKKDIQPLVFFVVPEPAHVPVVWEHPDFYAEARSVCPPSPPPPAVLL